MALEALSASELLNFIMYNDSSNINIDTTPLISCSNIINDNTASLQTENAGAGCSAVSPPAAETAAAQGGRKKRRRRAKVCKNKEEAENQRMTHIAVERNRRKQMNEHLAVLRSLMPESYVQRGDQASIVGGAIEFVKELEHMLQSLEANKFSLLNNNNNNDCDVNLKNNLGDHHDNNSNENLIMTSPFSQFFSYPQFSCSSSQNNNSCNNNNNNMGSKYTSQSKAAVADIEVTLIETHANIRILSRRRVRQLSKIVASFQSVLLTILHLNVATFDSRVLYSISAKVEEGCQLSSADDIATTVHHMLRIIEEEAAILCSHQS